MRAFEKYHPAVSGVLLFYSHLIAVFVWHPIIQLSALTGAAAFVFRLKARVRRLKIRAFTFRFFLWWR